MSIFVTLAAFTALQAMAQDPSLTVHEADANAIAITAFRTGKPIDQHVASVLAGYVQRNSFQQDRYGR